MSEGYKPLPFALFSQSRGRSPGWCALQKEVPLDFADWVPPHGGCWLDTSDSLALSEVNNFYLEIKPTVLRY